MVSPGQKLTAGHSNRSVLFLKAVSSLRNRIVLLILLGGICFIFIQPALADGGGPLPTNTPIPSTPLPATSLPLNQFTPTPIPGNVYPAPVNSTPEVKSFEIVIDSNQNATVQVVTPANQAALSRAEALEAQGNAPAEGGFTSPLWIFGFITLVIIIAVISAVARGTRKRA